MHISRLKLLSMKHLRLLYVFHYVINVFGTTVEGKNTDITSPVKENQEKHEAEIHVKDYRGWKSIKIYIPPSINKEDVLKILSSSDNVLTLSLKKAQKQVEADVAYGPESKILEKLSSTLNTELLCLDNVDDDKNYGHSPRIKSLTRRNTQQQQNQQQQQLDIPEKRLYWKTLDSNLQEKLDASTRQIVSSSDESYSWTSFHSYDSIMNFSKALAENHSSVEYITIGQTFEGRELFALLFSLRAKEETRKYKTERSKWRKYKKRNEAYEGELKNVIKGKLKQRSDKQNDPKRKTHRNAYTKNKKYRGGNYKNGRKGELKHEQTKQRWTKLRKKQKIKKKKSTREEVGSAPIIFIDGGIHAREWISSAVVTYIAQQLVNEGEGLLNEVTVILIPMANPDGYEYSRNYDRQWRKNRVNTSLPGTWGVDLNRNWDKGWNSTFGSSDNPEMENYRGPQPFSEAETQAMRDLALVYLQDLTFYLSLHSYTKSLLYPWGYTYQSLRRNRRLKMMARKIVQVLNGNEDVYDLGQSSHLLYLASGTSCDYMYSIGVPYAYTLELPYDDFVFPPEKIIPVAEDVWTALVCGIAKLTKMENAKTICALKLAEKK